MMQDSPKDESKLTRTKRAWARAGKFLTGAERATTGRLPLGQHVVKDWPILDLGTTPDINLAAWRLEVTGLVEAPFSLDWQGLTALPQTELQSDIHCVTTWSRYDNDLRGVWPANLIARARPHALARFVLLMSYDDYTTNLPLEDFLSPEALPATHWDGAP